MGNPNGFKINTPILSRLYLCKYMKRSEMFAFKTGPLYKYTFFIYRMK